MRTFKVRQNLKFLAAMACLFLMYGLYDSRILLGRECERALMSMFHKGGVEFLVVSEKSSLIVDGCGIENKDSFLELLKNSGFQVQELNVSNQGKSNIQDLPEYDFAVYAQRRPGGLFFWRFLTYYKITAYFLDQSLVHIYATADTTYP